MDVDEATDGGPPIPEPVTDGPGEAGSGWARGSDISDVSITFAPARLRDLLEVDDPPGVDVVPLLFCEALWEGVLGELSIFLFGIELTEVSKNIKLFYLL